MNATQEFIAGDTVQLKSGGPPMTINSQQIDGSFVCQWFRTDATVATASFIAEMLVRTNCDYLHGK